MEGQLLPFFFCSFTERPCRLFFLHIKNARNKAKAYLMRLNGMSKNPPRQ